MNLAFYILKNFRTYWLEHFSVIFKPFYYLLCMINVCVQIYESGQPLFSESFWLCLAQLLCKAMAAWASWQHNIFDIYPFHSQFCMHTSLNLYSHRHFVVILSVANLLPNSNLSTCPSFRYSLQIFSADNKDRSMIFLLKISN